MPTYADIPKWQIQEAAIRKIGKANHKAREKLAKALEPKRLSQKERDALSRADEDLEILLMFVKRALHHLYDAFEPEKTGEKP